MERFADQPLRPHPHLAVLFQDKLGGFVVATPLLRGLKEKYPDAVLDYFGGERTAELEASCPYIDARYSLHGRPGALRDLADFAARREQAAGPYDLAINLDFSPVNALATTILQPRYVVGRCYREDSRGELPFGDSQLERLQDPETFWAGEGFLAEFGDVVSTNFIGEIFCRIARVQTDFHRTEVPWTPPSVTVPDILLGTGGTRPAKLWPTSHWKRLIELCTGAGLTVGLLGAAPRVQQLAYGSADTEAELLATTPLIDLRGRLSLPEVAGALRVARACVTIDNGIMHLAVAVGTPTIAIFGASPWELWAPRVPWLHLQLPNDPCSLCRANRFRNDACLRDRHVCMESITADEVFSRLHSLLRLPSCTEEARDCRSARDPGGL
ncbi:MAG: glycosyltransferase family 9 protein [Chloroflexi bacterium]|nr:glycosyltransferase family 9 protein [Chloroflexota bacterium]